MRSRPRHSKIDANQLQGREEGSRTGLHPVQMLRFGIWIPNLLAAPLRLRKLTLHLKAVRPVKSPGSGGVVTPNTALTMGAGANCRVDLEKAVRAHAELPGRRWVSPTLFTIVSLRVEASPGEQGSDALRVWRLAEKRVRQSVSGAARRAGGLLTCLAGVDSLWRKQCGRLAAISRFFRLRPRRLARPRTPPFHGDNTGSNPVGDAKSSQELTRIIPDLSGHKWAQKCSATCSADTSR